MYIGVDLGGTNLRAALADGEGRLCHVVKTGTPAEKGPQAVADCIARQVRLLPGWREAKSVGIGAPGAADVKNGTLLLASNLPGMDGFPLVKTLETALEKPVYLENDANAACLGEALFGAGKGFGSVVYITVSTGIGGGIWENGQLLRGGRGFAGEFGAISLGPFLDSKNDLPPGAVEGLASGTALMERAERLGRPAAHAGEVFRLARAGDEAMAALAGEFVLHLAALMANLACVLDPQVFVLGGGVLKSAGYFWDDLLARYRAFAQAIYRDIPIKQAALGEAGLVGAAMLGRLGEGA